MIYQIAVPIAREISGAVAMSERKEYGDTTNPNHPSSIMALVGKEAMQELDDMLIDGYAIVDTFETKNAIATYRTYVLHKSEPVQKVASGTLQMVKSIARTQTYSKSTNQYFDYWKFELANGRSVNVFNHPDNERNTFKIAIAQGWQKALESLNYDEIYPLGILIPVLVSDDGNWLKLEQIAAISDIGYPYDWTFPQQTDIDELL